MEILHIDPKVLITQMGGFILLLIVFRAFLFKPIIAILDARREEIQSQYGDAEANRRAAEELKAEYEKHLTRIDEEMRAKITEAIKEGQSMREEIVADSRSRANAILAKAEEEIRIEKEKAMVELKTKVADLAIRAAGRLIDENLDQPKHHQLIGKTIDELGGEPK